MPLPVYTNQRIRRAAILTPFFLALGLTTGLTGAAMGGTSLRKFKQLSTGHCCIHRKNGEDPPTPTIPVRLPSHNGPTKSSGPRFTDCWIGGHLSLSKERMLFLLPPVWAGPKRYQGAFATGHKDLGFEFNKCMEFSFFPFLAPTIHGSSDNYLITPPIWRLYTPTTYKVYFQQTPAVSN